MFNTFLNTSQGWRGNICPALRCKSATSQAAGPQRAFAAIGCRHWAADFYEQQADCQDNCLVRTSFIAGHSFIALSHHAFLYIHATYSKDRPDKPFSLLHTTTATKFTSNKNYYEKHCLSIVFAI